MLQTLDITAPSTEDEMYVYIDEPSYINYNEENRIFIRDPDHGFQSIDELAGFLRKKISVEDRKSARTLILIIGKAWFTGDSGRLYGMLENLLPNLTTLVLAAEYFSFSGNSNPDTIDFTGLPDGIRSLGLVSGAMSVSDTGLDKTMLEKLFIRTTQRVSMNEKNLPDSMKRVVIDGSPYHGIIEDENTRYDIGIDGTRKIYKRKNKFI